MKYIIGTVALALTTSANAVTHYKLTDLGVVSTATTSVARAISDNGAIAGESGNAPGSNRGARFDGGAQFLPTLAGGTNTVIRGVNNSGVAAATVQNGANDRAALLTTGGATQLGGVAGYASAGALDINNPGVATGYVLSSGANAGLEGGLPLNSNATPQRAVTWTGGVGSLLSNGAGQIQNSVGVAINDAGAVAGIGRLANNNSTRALLWDAGGALTILSLGSGQTASRARAISSTGAVAGQVSGTIGVGGDFTLLGSVWSGSSQYLLNPTGAGYVQSTTRGINASGTVVGFANDNDGLLATSGQLWAFNGTGYTGYALDSLVINLGGWHTEAAQAINDRGDIVGFAFAPDGFQHGYLLTAVPEPASWALLIAGFGLTGAALRRRRTALA